MKKVLSFVLAGYLLLFSSICAFASTPSLNEEALKKSVLSRIQSVIQTNGGIIANVTPAIISIEKIQPIPIGAITLYAVKMKIQGAYGQMDEMVIVTEQTGQAQFGLVLNLATGEEMPLSQAKDVTSLQIDNSLASLYMEGTGNKTVQFVSDPFCGFCRQAFALLEQQADAIRSLSFIHWPLPMHPGADMVIWLMEYAKENAPAELFQAVVKFAYTTLRAPAAIPGKDVQEQMLEQFLSRFPELFGKLDSATMADFLKGKYQQKTIRIQSEMEKLGITGTPLIIVNGNPINGFDRAEIIKQLNK